MSLMCVNSFKRGPVPLLAFLLLLLSSDMSYTVASETASSNNNIGENIKHDPHTIVFQWLENRATWSEENEYQEPWKLVNEENSKNSKARFQNGYFFDSSALELRQSPNVRHPKLIAKRDINKGDLLVGIPSSSFVYPQSSQTYNQQHPCDVTFTVLDPEVYWYPDNDEKSLNKYPELQRFWRPFLDSIAEVNSNDNPREMWSMRELEILSKILGNEMEPKSNILGLWGESVDPLNKTNILCNHPNDPSENDDIWGRFYVETEYPEENLKYFKSILRTVLTRGWDQRMVPIYHWISRVDSSSSNVKHSVEAIDMSELKRPVQIRIDNDEGAEPVVYQLHASRAISEGEVITLPYHSVAQQLLITGTSKRENEDKPHRFWFQTLHDQEGDDPVFGTPAYTPYDYFLVWDYFPEKKSIEWIQKAQDQKHPTETLRPTQRQVLHAQYTRLCGIRNEIDLFAKEEESSLLGRAIVEYYELWVESLGVLLANSRPSRASDAMSCGTNEDEDKVCFAENALVSSYDTLERRRDPIDYNQFLFPAPQCSFDIQRTTYEKTKTQYASIEWSRSYIGGGKIDDDDDDDDKDLKRNATLREQDTCLFIENVVHSCLAFRPHVHETLIHYPASFLPKGGLKRVLYVGGGDLVLLHELLRYDSVETVIGLELDQMVVRGTFRHYGIQPKFEDKRVHWWFGDASKTLGLLPAEEYFETFDLVLIDLVAEIFDLLRVGEHNERLVDYLAKMTKPDGVLVRQEDWPEHNVVDFAKYTVDYSIRDMPHTCAQYFTMSSNEIDFAHRKRVDHELEGLVVYEPNVETNDHTSLWEGYRNNLVPPERICGKKEIADLPISAPSHGLFIVIEIENVTLSLGDTSNVQNVVETTLEGVGFTDIRIHHLAHDSSFTDHSLFSFEEGYLILRSYANLAYCSMDVQLWNDISQYNRTLYGLVEALGGNMDTSTSSFAITTGGMLGMPNIREPSTDIYPSVWCKNSTVTDFSDVHNGQKIIGLQSAIRSTLTNFFRQGNPVVFVLCPTSDNRCRARDDFDYGSSNVLSFDECLALKDDDLTLAECEQELIKFISAQISSHSIDAVVIDPDVSKPFGRIMKKVFVTNPQSYQWLSHDYVVIAPAIVTTELSDFTSSWRYQLLERFRTDLVEFSPAFHATLAFNYVPSLFGWTMGLFSAGNKRFYDGLISSMENIRKEGIIRQATILEAKMGAVPYIPDHKSSKWATHSDYDLKPAAKQWSEQKPVGVQKVIQYDEKKLVHSDIDVGSKVLYFREQFGFWWIGKLVDKQNLSDGQVEYTVLDSEHGDEFYQYLPREKIIAYGETASDEVPFGTMVLADGDENQGYLEFYDAQIVGRDHDGLYKVYYLGDGSTAVVDRKRVVLKSDSSYSGEVKSFSSCSEFDDFILAGVDDASTKVTYRRTIGQGCLLTISGTRETNVNSSATVTASYDGRTRVDLNEFKTGDDSGSLEIFDSISMRMTSKMNVVQTDIHPRGYGRVVNLEADLHKPYFGTKYPPSLV